YPDPRNPAPTRGRSDFPIRHRLRGSPIYAAPWFKRSGGWQNLVLGGYTFTSIFTARTGTPCGAFDSTSSLNTGGGFGRPRSVPASSIADYSTGTPLSVGVNSYNLLNLPAANTTPFNPALGISDFGPFPANMMPRNALRGPGAWA